MDNDDKRMYFRNIERRSDEEEFQEIMAILKQSSCTIGKTDICPDCNMIHCEIDGIPFNVITSIDGDGTFIYCDNSEGIKQLEEVFVDTSNRSS